MKNVLPPGVRLKNTSLYNSQDCMAVNMILLLRGERQKSLKEILPKNNNAALVLFLHLHTSTNTKSVGKHYVYNSFTQSQLSVLLECMYNNTSMHYMYIHV